MTTRRHALTLIEMMIVIILVGVIGSALAVNLKGALDKGRAFKTQEMQKKIESVLNIALLDQEQTAIKKNWAEQVATSPLAKVTPKNKKILDAWGFEFAVDFDEDQGQFIATSQRIDADGNIIKPNAK